MNKNTCECTLTKECGISNIITSIALQENSIAHIINAESEKLDAILSIDKVSFEYIMLANTSVKDTLEALLQLEQLLQRKLDLIVTCIDSR